MIDLWIEALLLYLVVFLIGIGIAWLVWGRRSV